VKHTHIPSSYVLFVTPCSVLLLLRYFLYGPSGRGALTLDPVYICSLNFSSIYMNLSMRAQLTCGVYEHIFIFLYYQQRFSTVHIKHMYECMHLKPYKVVIDEFPCFLIRWYCHYNCRTTTKHKSNCLGMQYANVNMH